MNESQTIFALFYALYFAATTTLTGKFQPFDTPTIYKRNCLALGRFVVSFILLNIVPLAYFVLIFQWLNGVSQFNINFVTMLVLLILSLAGFGFYRIYFGVMIVKLGGKYLFYGTNLPKPVTDELNQRDNSHRDVFAHIIPGLIWVGVTLAIGYCWVKSQAN